MSVMQEERPTIAEIHSTGVGASETAILLGLNPYKTPFRLAQEKLGLVPPFEGNRFTEAGNRLEEVIARWYADETGYKIARNNKTFRLDGRPYILGHIDRRVLNHRKVLECKSADKWTMSKWGESGTDEMPDHYYIQTQQYLLFPSFDAADVAALIGGNDLRIYPDIQPDTELQDMMVEAIDAFWSLVSRGDLPEPTTPEDARAKWSKDSGEPVYADDQVMEWEHELQKAVVTKKDVEAKIDDLKTKQMSYMKEATVLYDPHGNKLHTWKEQALSSFDEKALAEEKPEVYSECLVEKFDRKTCKSKFPDVYSTYQKKGRVFR